MPAALIGSRDPLTRSDCRSIVESPSADFSLIAENLESLAWLGWPSHGGSATPASSYLSSRAGRAVQQPCPEIVLVVWAVDVDADCLVYECIGPD